MHPGANQRLSDVIGPAYRVLRLSGQAQYQGSSSHQSNPAAPRGYANAWPLTGMPHQAWCVRITTGVQLRGPEGAQRLIGHVSFNVEFGSRRSDRLLQFGLGQLNRVFRFR